MNRILFRAARNIKVPKDTYVPTRRFLSESKQRYTIDEKYFEWGAMLSGSVVGSVYGYKKSEEKSDEFGNTILFGFIGAGMGLIFPVSIVVIPCMGVFYVLDRYDGDKLE